MKNHNLLRTVAVAGALAGGTTAFTTPAGAAIKPPSYSFDTFARQVEDLPLYWHQSGIIGKWAVANTKNKRAVLIEINVAAQPTPDSIHIEPIEVAISIFPKDTNMSHETPGSSVVSDVAPSIEYWIGNNIVSNRHNRWANIDESQGQSVEVSNNYTSIDYSNGSLNSAVQSTSSKVAETMFNAVENLAMNVAIIASQHGNISYFPETIKG